jgi:hypothetical protein
MRVFGEILSARKADNIGSLNERLIANALTEHS